MKTVLYQKDNDKVLVNELVVDEQQFITYNEQAITYLLKKDYYNNTTSDLMYVADKEHFDERRKYNLEKYHKIYSNETSFNVGSATYLIPKINKKSSSIYNKFLTKFPYYSRFCGSPNMISPQLHLEKLPKYEDIKDYYKNYTFKDELFYFSKTDLAIKLDDELRLLYKLLYIKNFDLDKKDIINKNEFKKIFTLNLKEVLSYDTYMDIISNYSSVMNEHVIQTINGNLEKDEEKIKKIKLILK